MLVACCCWMFHGSWLGEGSGKHRASSVKYQVSSIERWASGLKHQVEHLVFLGGAAAMSDKVPSATHTRQPRTKMIPERRVDAFQWDHMVSNKFEQIWNKLYRSACVTSTKFKELITHSFCEISRLDGWHACLWIVQRYPCRFMISMSIHGYPLALHGRIIGKLIGKT